MADDDPTQHPVEPAERRSEWSLEWSGVIPLLAIVAVVIAAWRVVGSFGSGSDDPTVAELPAATTTEPIVATTTTAPATTVVPSTAPAATTTAVPEPTVIISGEMKPCRFGDNCLVASFTIEGFDGPPDRFTCIYPNSRRDFSFRDGGKDDACITADEGDTITIEVGGVVSRTISEANLEGE